MHTRRIGPLSVSAMMTADAPGRLVTAIPASLAAFTKRYPGSEISGVPASDTSATGSDAISASRPSRACASAWSSYRISRCLMPR